MAQTWPVGVPNCIERGSLSNAPIDAVLRSPVDIGKPMTRNRYTSELYNTSWRIQMTSAEKDILDDWYHNTLNRVLTFDFVSQHAAINKEYSFVSPPSSNHIGGDQYIVNFNLESV